MFSPYSAAGKASFCLMFGHDAHITKLLLPKLGYMGDEECAIDPDAIREIDKMGVLNLKIQKIGFIHQLGTQIRLNLK